MGRRPNGTRRQARRPRTDPRRSAFNGISAHLGWVKVKRACPADPRMTSKNALGYDADASNELLIALSNRHKMSGALGNPGAL